MPTGLPCPLGDVSYIICSHPEKDILIEDNKTLSFIGMLDKCGASVLQQLLASQRLVSVKPWLTHVGQEGV